MRRLESEACVAKPVRFHQGIQRRMVLVINFSPRFFFCFVVVAIFDLVHDLDGIHGLC